jgi:hypothetical protein
MDGADLTSSTRRGEFPHHCRARPPGATSLSISRHLPVRRYPNCIKPVALPPRRARVFTAAPPLTRITSGASSRVSAGQNHRMNVSTSMWRGKGNHVNGMAIDEVPKLEPTDSSAD